MKPVSNAINTIITTGTGFRFGRPVFGFGWFIRTISTVITTPQFNQRWRTESVV